ncbi:phage protein GemA/Gp16 family protein [Propionivibrio dicarboxylicus]|uniref:Mu-like prophage protein gp16 n=1 Tax=Propionivibrio dicarboxylicus TaxID=83767 RepID=A0A1G8LAG1_9RHOO|nr:phage protein GemA/Gp16 family protein [Propionivibrio dicarboxylicus]SDI52632.1 Protein of unknown function [Propionivibrio dicarboxylicus]
MNPSAALRGIDRLKQRCRTIQTGKTWLAKNVGFDDSEYRALLMRVAGVRSSKDLCDVRAAEDVILAMRKLGFPAASKAGKGDASVQGGEWRFVFRLPGERMSLGKKIFRCAQKIGAKQTPPVPVMSKAWVEGIARQATGLNAPGVAGKVSRKLETCDYDELRMIVQILESWAKKIGA